MSAPLVNAAASATGTVKGAFRATLERLSPKQRQYAMLGAILLGGVGMLWLIFAFTDNGAKDKIAKSPAGTLGTVTNIGVMPPGQQVNPVDQWVGTAGSKLAQYESEREEQGRLNKDRQAFEARTMQRFSDLEQRLTSAAQAAQAPALPAPPLQPPVTLPPAAACRCHRHPQRPLLPPVGRCLPQRCRRDSPTCRWRLRCPCRWRRF
jgi:type IV secretory pathway VirB10-like protein